MALGIFLKFVDSFSIPDLLREVVVFGILQICGFLIQFFSYFLSRFAAKGIENLCNQLMTKTSSLQWLFAIPLLHFLRGDSKPFEEPSTLGSPKRLEWWGAQNLQITNFQRSHKQ